MPDEAARVERGRVTDEKIQANNVVQKRVTDLRLLIIFVFVVALAVIPLGVLQYQGVGAHHRDVVFERAIVANCLAINKGNATFNGVLDQLTTNARNSTSLTAPQKAEALRTYASLHLPISVCPPIH